jgi:MFS-type transporter involved in bile tolerance (Atg22 family)
MADTLYLASLTTLQIPVQNEFNLTDVEVGRLGMVIACGMLCGAFFWGLVSDVIGLRPAFMLTHIWYSQCILSQLHCPLLDNGRNAIWCRWKLAD